jgi:hypothetical protein
MVSRVSISWSRSWILEQTSFRKEEEKPMHSMKSFRPQNQNPEGLIRFSEEVARRNEEAVRATVQAMQLRRMESHEITIQAVVGESGVSRATIYRCDKLFALVRKANPKLRRREAEQKIRDDLAHTQAETAAVVQEKEQYKKEARLAQLGSQGLQQQIIQQKKKILELQNENTDLKERLSHCTCESKNQREPHPAH